MRIRKPTHPQELLADPDNLVCSNLTTNKIATVARQHFDQTVEVQQCV